MIDIHYALALGVVAVAGVVLLGMKLRETKFAKSKLGRVVLAIMAVSGFAFLAIGRWLVDVLHFTGSYVIWVLVLALGTTDPLERLVIWGLVPVAMIGFGFWLHARK